MRRHNGFTLIEVLAATLLTGMVITAAVAFYINLSRATRAATERTREGRHAAAILDRVAGDLEGALLLATPEGHDPLENPWLFLAEDRSVGDGADRIKFVSANHRSRGSVGHVSNLAVVVYALRPGDDDRGELWRWVSPGLPESLDTSFPSDEEGGMVLAEGLSSFSARFLSEAGEWTSEWNSSTLLRADQLPVAAEILIAMADEEGDAFGDFDDLGGREYIRRVTLPVPAIDLAAMLDRGGDGIDEEDCMTVSVCIDQLEEDGQLSQDELDDLRSTTAPESNRCAKDSELLKALDIQCD